MAIIHIEKAISGILLQSSPIERVQKKRELASALQTHRKQVAESHRRSAKHLCKRVAHSKGTLKVPEQPLPIIFGTTDKRNTMNTLVTAALVRDTQVKEGQASFKTMSFETLKVCHIKEFFKVIRSFKPAHRKTGEYVFIYKASKPFDEPSSYRPITLVNIMAKIMRRGHHKSLSHLLQPIPLTQHDFMDSAAKHIMRMAKFITEELEGTKLQPMNKTLAT
ncbi:hypothetical protein EVAR_103264_1 [Eumeta japonica]|uniref:Uncharacterized protein n=1 Tax=Eumeta variegata TaxID=151549 RepID=A0A4C1YA63_EUMVA|nr:hypothetical protein EVAR_103264_1 [Eumeta japonica]